MVSEASFDGSDCLVPESNISRPLWPREEKVAAASRVPPCSICTRRERGTGRGLKEDFTVNCFSPPVTLVSRLPMTWDPSSLVFWASRLSSLGPLVADVLRLFSLISWAPSLSSLGAFVFRDLGLSSPVTRLSRPA